MIPGIDPRQMKAMMRQMGMSQTDIDATEVIIKTSSGKNLVFSNPNVQKIVMRGEATFQLSGEYTEVEEEAEITISDDDVQMVVDQANCSEDEAKSALVESNGDIAEAIVKLTE